MLHIRDADPELELVHATVAAREPSGFSFHYLIDRGTDDGIADGDPVITADGPCRPGGADRPATGRGSRRCPTRATTWAHTSRARRTMASSKATRRADSSAAVFPTSRAARPSSPGDIVETSGLGGVFPRGLRIGRVESPLPGDQLYTSAARIAPAVDYEGMREVYVVVGFSQ